VANSKQNIAGIQTRNCVVRLCSFISVSHSCSWPFSSNYLVTSLLPRNPIVKQIAGMLVTELIALPIEGEGYSGIHPAFCFLIACACTEEEESYQKLRNILATIGSVNKSVWHTSKSTSKGISNHPTERPRPSQHC
jgi:hypothetical protein